MARMLAFWYVKRLENQRYVGKYRASRQPQSIES